MKVKVSIIVATYNQSLYLPKALTSLLTQKTNFNYEILVGDDASTDGTQGVCLDFAKRYPNKIKVFLHAENLGASRNAYELCKHAKGDYLAFCEGDDFWLSSDKLQIQVDFLDKRPEYIGCYHRCLLVDENDAILPFQYIRWIKYKETFTFEDFSGGLFLPGQTATIVKRNIFKGKDFRVFYEFDRDISDRIINAEYLLRGNFHCIEKTLSAYRVNGHKESLNITNLRFTKSGFSRYLLDLKMTRFIEDYVGERAERIVFCSKRKEILSRAIIYCLRHPLRKNFRGLREIFSEDRMRWEYLSYLPVFVLKRIREKILYQV